MLEAADEPGRAAANPDTAEAASGPAVDAVRVLLIEDNAGDARLMREFLEYQAPLRSSAPRHEVVVAARLSEGLERLRADSFDVALLDLSLPDAWGLDTLRQLHAAAPELPVVVLTGLDDEAVALEAVQIGAQDYLVKGEVDRALLVRSLRYALERARTNQRLREALRMGAAGKLASAVAHDLSNLLTAITGYGDLLVHRLQGQDDLLRSAEEIRKAAGRSAEFVRQLMALSRPPVIRGGGLDLNRLLRSVEDDLRRLVGPAVELRLSLSPDLALVRADTEQAEQAILSLALSARAAMPAGGVLCLETRDVLSDTPGESWARLRLYGMGGRGGPEVAPQASATPLATGEAPLPLGPGLAAVYGFAQRSGGSLQVEIGGEGPCYALLLPQALPTGSEAVDAGRRKHSAQEAPAILLVEDEEAVRELVKDVLRLSGYRVREARSAEEALRLIQEQPGDLDLLVTDVLMPGLDGRQLAERLWGRRPDLGVLFISGYAQETQTDLLTLERGAAFLAKPFTPDALAQKVRELLERETRDRA